MRDTGFPYAADNTAQILILGSMPSRKSLAADQYYAHPQNAFWPIMAELFGFAAELDYEARLAHLRANHVALWDVAYQCIRPGSLDSAIDIKSVVANDFISFFNTHPHIRAIYFNGRKAEELYRRLILPDIQPYLHPIELHLLPSTSPANAGINRAQKLAAWRMILGHLIGSTQQGPTQMEPTQLARPDKCHS